MPTTAAGLANRHRPSRHRRSANSALLTAALLLFALELFPSTSASAPTSLVVAAGSLRLGRSEAMPQSAGVAPWIVRVQRLVVDLPISVSVAEDGRLVDAHAGNMPRPPASDEKLLLSMALLD